MFDRCYRCQYILWTSSLLDRENNKWCSDCSRCLKCHLKIVGKYYPTEQGKFLCDDCIWNCFVCQKKVNQQDGFIGKDGTVYCRICKDKKIEEDVNRKFEEIEEKHRRERERLEREEEERNRGNDNNPNSRCVKCYKKVQSGEYWYHPKTPEVKTCDECHKKEIEKIKEDKRIMRDIGKRMDLKLYIRLTDREKEVLGDEGISIVNSYNQDLLQSQKPSEEDKDYKVIVACFFLFFISMLVIIIFNSIGKKKQTDTEKNKENN